MCARDRTRVAGLSAMDMEVKMSRPLTNATSVVPNMFRGNCKCGRWLMIPVGIIQDDPIRCECGRSYWYELENKQFHRKEHSIIFLDVDGVLINFESRTFGHPRCVENLNKITDATDAVIVVSSSWRKGGVERISQILRDWGVTGRVVDVTPDLSTKGKEIFVAVQRGEEIQAWIERNKRNLSDIAILDDGTDMAELVPFLIKTEYEIGLSEQDVDLALQLLTVDKTETNNE
jgi:hypothetical protein